MDVWVDGQARLNNPTMMLLEVEVRVPDPAHGETGH